jgi:hypothetical protein
MTLTNGTDTITLNDDIQIRAYKASGYEEIETPEKKRGAKNGDNKS